MKNVILKYGLISGAIIAGLQLLLTLIIKNIGYEKVGFDNSAYYGYTVMILAMAIIYFAIKAYRDTENDGKVSFIKGIMIGLGVTLISCVCYTLMWMFVYYNFMPTFMEDFATHYMANLKASGASSEVITKTQAQMNQALELYKTPLGIFAITMIEPLPVGIIISLISAFILKRK